VATRPAPKREVGFAKRRVTKGQPVVIAGRRWLGLLNLQALQVSIASAVSSLLREVPIWVYMDDRNGELCSGLQRQGSGQVGGYGGAAAEELTASANDSLRARRHPGQASRALRYGLG